MNGERKPKGKVCHIGKASSILVQRWVNFFAKIGWEVDLITFEPAEQGKLDPKVRQHVITPGKAPVIGFLKALLGMRKHLKRIKPDIIHGHSIPAYGIYAGLHSWMGGKEPIVVSAWGFYHIKAHRGIKRRLDRLCIKKARILTTTSPDLKNALIKDLQADESKFRVFSWGIDLNIFRVNYEDEKEKLRRDLKIDKGVPVIISPRNMSPYYRIQNIIKAVPKVLETHPESVFIILRGYGTEDFESEMRKEAKKLGIIKSVRFIQDLLTPYEMAIYFNISNIMISISITDQLPAVLLEAMACDTFPILSDTTGCKAWVTHEKNGLYIDGDNIEEIAKAINFAIENPGFLKNAFEYNTSFIKKYEDWEVNSKKMEAIYEELISERN